MARGVGLERVVVAALRVEAALHALPDLILEPADDFAYAGDARVAADLGRHHVQRLADGEVGPRVQVDVGGDAFDGAELGQ